MMLQWIRLICLLLIARLWCRPHNEFIRRYILVACWTWRRREQSVRREFSFKIKEQKTNIGIHEIKIEFGEWTRIATPPFRQYTKLILFIKWIRCFVLAAGSAISCAQRSGNEMRKWILMKILFHFSIYSSGGPRCRLFRRPAFQYVAHRVMASTDFIIISFIASGSTSKRKNSMS